MPRPPENSTTDKKAQGDLPLLQRTSAIFANLNPIMLRSAILSLLLLWPAFLNGGAFPFPDTVSYVKGGEYAVGLVLGSSDKKATSPSIQTDSGLAQVQTESEKAQSLSDPDATVLETQPKPNQSQAIVGMRSAVYSVYAYLMSLFAFKGLFIAAVQTMMTAFTAVVFLHCIAPTLPFKQFGLIALLTAVFTSAPWYGSLAMPDMLGAAALLSMLLLFYFPDKLGIMTKAALIAITAFAITAHPATLLLVGAVGAACGAKRLIKDIVQKKPFAFGLYAVAATPLVLGTAALLATSMVGFGEASVAPKRYPIVLARSITDGPALWHLEKNCDKYQYAICEVFDEIPVGVGEFLWEETGLRYNATPEQMDRIRAEEMTIVRRASREYPFAQIRTAIRNTYEQLTRVGIPSMRFGNHVVRNENGQWHLKSDPNGYRAHIQPAETVQIIVIYASLGLLIYVLFVAKTMQPAQINVLIALGTALFINAAICGILSGPADRYQGRIIWILPMFTVAIALARPFWEQAQSTSSTKGSELS